MIWNRYEDIYQIIMQNQSGPFHYENNKLYVITSWSLGTQMNGSNIHTNKAEGKEIVSYGNE